MAIIDFETRRLLAEARLTVPDAARALRRAGIEISSARLSLCVRGLEPWHPDDRGRVHRFLREWIGEGEWDWGGAS